MAIKILATGDVHIGKKSSGIYGNHNRLATKNTWKRLVEYAIQHQVDVLVLSGDIVDQDNRFFEAIGPLQAGFDKLQQVGIEVYMVAGNHDYKVLADIADSPKYQNVHFLGKSGRWETKNYKKEGVEMQFIGWSFPTRHYKEDPFLTFEQELIDLNIPVLGLVHGEVDTLEGQYAPIDQRNFLNRNVDAWILGHIHKPAVLREANPFICYPGSPHALSAKESGAHGPLLLKVEGKGQITIETLPFSPVRYETISIEIHPNIDDSMLRGLITSKLLDFAESISQELEEVVFLVCDLSFHGQHGRIREFDGWLKDLTDLDLAADSLTRIRIRKCRVNLRPKLENLEELAKQSSPVGVLAGSILALESGGSTPFLDNLFEKWQVMQEKISRAKTYQSLRIGENLSPDEARPYLLQECNRLLGELISQQA